MMGYLYPLIQEMPFCVVSSDTCFFRGEHLAFGQLRQNNVAHVSRPGGAADRCRERDRLARGYLFRLNARIQVNDPTAPENPAGAGGSMAAWMIRPFDNTLFATC